MADYEEYFADYIPQSFSDTKAPAVISKGHQDIMDWYDKMQQDKSIEAGQVLAAQYINDTREQIERLKSANEQAQHDFLENVQYKNDWATKQDDTSHTGTAQSINDFVEKNWNYIHQVFTSLRKAGATPAQAAGICGNIYQESRFDPNARGDNGEAHGLFQMHKHHRDAYRKYRQTNGLEDNLDALCSYVFNSAMNTTSLGNGYGATMNMRSSKLPSDTSTWFCAAFERPSARYANINTRNMAANLILKKALGQIVNPYSQKSK